MISLFNPFELVIQGESLKTADKIVDFFPVLCSGKFPPELLALFKTRDDIEWTYADIVLPNDIVYEKALIVVQLKDKKNDQR